jgi:FtsZ-binding cell division protein ZapB
MSNYDALVKKLKDKTRANTAAEAIDAIEELQAKVKELEVVNKRLTETKCLEWNIHEHTFLRKECDTLRHEREVALSEIQYLSGIIALRDTEERMKEQTK